MPGTLMSQRLINYTGRPKPSNALKLPVLVSYEYLRKMRQEDRDWLLTKSKRFGWELLLDSGGFSALNSGSVISVEEYTEFLKTYEKSFFRYFALDVIGNAEGTVKNQEYMLNAGLNPIPIHILGHGQEEMDSHFGISSLVGCGGLRRPHRGAAPLNYLHQKMKWANGRDVHWLGRVRIDEIVSLKPFSVDCSDWTQGQVWGLLGFYVGRGKWVRTRRKDRHKFAINPKMQRIIDIAGFKREDFYKDESWYRDKEKQGSGDNFFSLMCNAVSWIDFSMETRRKVGTRVFLASTMIPQDLVGLQEAWKRWKAHRKRMEIARVA